MRPPTLAALPALGVVLALAAGCAGESARRDPGDAVTEADATLLAGLLERNHDRGGADFVVTAPYGPEAVLTLTGEVDFRSGTGRAQAVLGLEGSEDVRTVFFSRDELWIGDVPGVEEALADTGAVYLSRPIAVAQEQPPLVDVLVTVLLNLSAEDGDDPAAFLDAGYSWQGRRSIDGRPTELFDLPGGRTVAVSSTADVLVQFATPVPVGSGADDVEVTATLAEHGRRTLTLPDEEQTAPAADHPELVAALGL
jgi:hypothetical protein